MNRQLVAQLLHQKWLALERTGMDMTGRPPMKEDKAMSLYGDAMDKMAAIVADWGADPGVLMESCFAFSRSKRHMDGPQLNMLGSRKFLMQAVAYHMELPRDAAEDMMSKASMIKKMDTEAASHFASLRKHMELTMGSQDVMMLMQESKAAELAMHSTVPALHRFLLCPMSPTLGRLLIPDILETLRVNLRMRLWAESKGWEYTQLAAYYNTIQRKHEHHATTIPTT